LSLVAPPSAKRRRTVKKVLVEVKPFAFLITRVLQFLTHHLLRIFRLEPNNLQYQNLPMPRPLVRPLLSFLKDEHWHLPFYFDTCRRNNRRTTGGCPRGSTSKSTQG
jgi:hypothetical protein